MSELDESDDDGSDVSGDCGTGPMPRTRRTTWVGVHEQLLSIHRNVLALSDVESASDYDDVIDLADKVMVALKRRGLKRTDDPRTTSHARQ